MTDLIIPKQPCAAYPSAYPALIYLVATHHERFRPQRIRKDQFVP